MTDIQFNNRHRYEYDHVEGIVYCKLDFMNFPGYRVGEDGSVWTRRPRNGEGGLANEWKRMKGRMSKGYLRVCLYSGGVQKTIGIHRLVMSAFVGFCPRGMEVLH